MKKRDIVTVPFGFVLFTIVIFALSPSQVVSGWLQGSPDALDAVVGIGVFTGNTPAGSVGEANVRGATVFVEKLGQNGESVRVEVELGLREDGKTQIKRGLASGDQVIIRAEPDEVGQPGL